MHLSLVCTFIMAGYSFHRMPSAKMKVNLYYRLLIGHIVLVQYQQTQPLINNVTVRSRSDCFDSAFDRWLSQTSTLTHSVTMACDFVQAQPSSAFEQLHIPHFTRFGQSTIWFSNKFQWRDPIHLLDELTTVTFEPRLKFGTI